MDARIELSMLRIFRFNTAMRRTVAVSTHITARRDGGSVLEVRPAADRLIRGMFR